MSLVIKLNEISKQINSKIIGFLLYQYDWHELLLKFTSNSHCTAFSSSKFGRNRMGESESNSRRTYRQILKYLTQPFFAPMQMDAESWSTIKMYASFWMWVLLLWSSYNICLSEISRFIVAENKLKKKKMNEMKINQPGSVRLCLCNIHSHLCCAFEINQRDQKMIY